MKRKKKSGVRAPIDVLVVDESVRIHRKKGNGVLRRQIWFDPEGNVTRYSLAYINHRIFHGDNGRVLGYDNAHDFHHKHYMGEVQSVAFTCFENIENLFRQKFERLHAQIKAS